MNDQMDASRPKSPSPGRAAAAGGGDSHVHLVAQLPEGQPAIRVIAQPSAANIHGDVFGGWIMAQVDMAGAVPAIRRANGRVATVAVTSFLFKQPVFVGDLLSFYARIVRTGRTSVTVDVEVFAERNHLPPQIVRVTEATLVYVATGPDRAPRELPREG